jgi:hypothetical protein
MTIAGNHPQHIVRIFDPTAATTKG